MEKTGLFSGSVLPHRTKWVSVGAFGATAIMHARLM